MNYIVDVHSVIKYELCEMTWDHCKGHKRPRRGSGAERSPSPPHTDLSSSVQTQGLGAVTVSAVLQSSCNVTYVNLTSL